MAKRPLILVTNDDGINAPGLKYLVNIVSLIGDVAIVAPDSPKSATSQAITINSPLYVSKVNNHSIAKLEYQLSGTPADCIKFGVNEILQKKPDICVSGINHGSNSSVNVLYSGTVGAAIEAGIQGIPAVGFSVLDYRWDAKFDHMKKIILSIIHKVIKNKLPSNIILNVNFPKSKVKGVKVCRQANTHWEEKFWKRKNPMGKDYYWLTGDFIDNDKSNETDEYALKNGYASIVPIKFDLTAKDYIQTLKKWDFNE
tara:strand:+ start:382 stop:1149 length:768 start_codon:yes stop_codon:yes gene_type:complete